jgi:hypothetical protein
MLAAPRADTLKGNDVTAQYESRAVPLAVILIVPMCLLFAMLGV